MKLLNIILGVFSLISVASSGEFVSQFNDKNLDAWEETVMFDIIVDEASWVVKNGELRGSVPMGTNRFLTIGNEKWEDYEVAYDVMPVKFHGSGNIAIAARVKRTLMVVCMIGDSPKFLAPGEALVPGSMATCLRGDMKLGNQLQVLEKTPSPFLKLNKWSRLKLRVQGDTLSFWVNDTSVFVPVVMEPLKGEALLFLSGAVGLGLAGYTAQFDNLRVTGPDILEDGGFAISPIGKLATTWGHFKDP
jgi:hypothetical protein